MRIFSTIWIFLIIITKILCNVQCKVDQCAFCEDEFSNTCVSCEQGYYLKTIYGSERGKYYNDCWSISKLVAVILLIAFFTVGVFGLAYLAYKKGKKKRIEELKKKFKEKKLIENERKKKFEKKKIDDKKNIIFDSMREDVQREEMSYEMRAKKWENQKKIQENKIVQVNQVNELEKDYDNHLVDQKARFEFPQERHISKENFDKLKKLKEIQIEKKIEKKEGEENFEKKVKNENLETKEVEDFEKKLKDVKEENSDFRRNRRKAKLPYIDNSSSRNSYHQSIRNRVSQKTPSFTQEKNPNFTMNRKVKKLEESFSSNSVESIGDKYYTSPQRKIFSKKILVDEQKIEPKIRLNVERDGKRVVFENYENENYSGFTIWKKKENNKILKEKLEKIKLEKIPVKKDFDGKDSGFSEVRTEKNFNRLREKSLKSTINKKNIRGRDFEMTIVKAPEKEEIRYPDNLQTDYISPTKNEFFVNKKRKNQMEPRYVKKRIIKKLPIKQRVRNHEPIIRRRFETKNFQKKFINLKKF